MPSVVQVLTTADPMQKAALTHRAWQQFCAGSMSVGVAQPSDRPARPEVPQVRTFWYASAPDPVPLVACELWDALRSHHHHVKQYASLHVVMAQQHITAVRQPDVPTASSV